MTVCATPPIPLADGSVIRFRYHGAFDYGRVTTKGHAYELLAPGAVQVGERVHQGVWKKDAAGTERFQARGTWIYSRPMPGDRR